MAKVQVELYPTYRVNEFTRSFEIIPWLREVDAISVVTSDDAPPLSVVVNNRVVAVVDPFDEPGLSSRNDHGSTLQRIREFKPALVLKYQWRRGIEYPPGTISAGYPCVNEVARPSDLLTRPRPIKVTARMRVNGDYHWAANTEWMRARSRIVSQAKLLSWLGHNTRWGLASQQEYIAELWDSQIGFAWNGNGYLTHRLIEYIRAGVVPITRPLGREWPIREDVILEHNVHCVFCPDQFRFAEEASRLLLDPQKIVRIRRNLLQLWDERLCPRAQGNWLWSKLEPHVGVS